MKYFATVFPCQYIIFSREKEKNLTQIRFTVEEVKKIEFFKGSFLVLLMSKKWLTVFHLFYH